MNRRATMQGVAPLASGAAPARPSGHYSKLAPELSHGTVVNAVTADGSSRVLELIEREDEFRCFVDVDCAPVNVCRWRPATRAEADSFIHERRIGQWADHAAIHGALSLAKKLRALPALARGAALFSVASVLQDRGQKGKAEQVLSCRFSDEGLR